MTSEHVNSFVTDLVQMAKAMERVPQLEQDVSILNDEINRLELRNTDLAVSLEASRTYCASLEQRLHDAEVAVTAAELRFLECDDAKGTLERSLYAMRGEIDGVLAAIRPVAEPVHTATVTEGWQAVTGERTEPRDTFQGVKTEPTVHTGIPLQDAPLSPLPNASFPFVGTAIEVSTDASSSEGTEGSVPVDPTPSADGMGAIPSCAASESADSHTNVASSEGVSVPSDPIQNALGSVDATLPDAVPSSTDASITTSARHPRYYDYSDHSPF